MLHIKSLLLALACLFLAGTVSAHTSHGADTHSYHGEEPVDSNSASRHAHLVIQRMVSEKRLEVSWVEISAAEVSSKESGQGPVWSVRYNNPEMEDVDRQNLYVILDELGNVIIVNHDGRF